MNEDTIVLGTTLAAASGPLHRVAASGGSDPVPITTLGTGERVHQAPRMLPDGRHVLFTVHGSQGMQFAVTALGSGTHELIGLEGSDGRFSEPGAIIVSRENSLFEAPFDLATLRVTGPEIAVLPDARVIQSGQIGMLDLDRSGRLVYVARERSNTQQVAWVDGAGRLSPISSDRPFLSRPRITGDGGRFVAAVAGPRLRIVDATRGLPIEAGSSWFSIRRRECPRSCASYSHGEPRPAHHLRASSRERLPRSFTGDETLSLTILGRNPTGTFRHHQGSRTSLA